MKNAFLRWLSLAAGVLAGAAPMAAAAPMLSVELLIYSGRPNPAFTIDDPQQVADILNAAAALPRNPQMAESERALPPSRLGYQGLLVTNHSTTVPALKSFVVYHSAVQLAFADNRAGAHRIDAGAALEQRLLDHARRRRLVDDALLDQLTSAP